MEKSLLLSVTSLAILLVGTPGVVDAQGGDTSQKFIQVATGYRVVANITYFTANNYESKLDVYQTQPRSGAGPNPTVMFIHGGGGVLGTKEGWLFNEAVFPYFEMGWTVVNVEYRLAAVAQAPAAVEDVRCALKWIHRNAKQYNFDLNKLVVSGASIGGMFATLAGILPVSADFDRQCLLVSDGLQVTTEAPKVSAIVDWYGVMDMADTLDGPNARNWAVAWVGSNPNRHELAKRLSPLTYIRPGLPPILIVHGDKDDQVLHTHAVKLQQALAKAGVPHELHTVVGGGHGRFTNEQNYKIWATIRGFLNKHGLTPSTN